MRSAQKSGLTSCIWRIYEDTNGDERDCSGTSSWKGSPKFLIKILPLNKIHPSKIRILAEIPGEPPKMPAAGNLIKAQTKKRFGKYAIPN